MDTIPKIILHNPFRILGVYANSPVKDVVANKGKATAFLKVNRPVEYSLDLKGILNPPVRTLELMNEAEAHISIAKEQIKYAQFWFLQKMTPLDDIAFNHLFAGNIAGAEEIWSKQESLSSLQNKLVCFLIEDKYRAAVMAAEKLYEKFGDMYLDKVLPNTTLQMTGTDLLHQFLDTLCEEIGIQKIIGCVTEAEAKAYIRTQSIGPLISKISLEVDKTKKIDRKDPNARIEGARKLVTSTKVAFSQLKSILPSTDPQYQMIADKLGLEILQCGIDYFNNSEDDDAPHTAMKMQKYAQSVVVGSLAKQRCEENCRVLQKIIDELPPKEVLSEDKAIKTELANYVRLADKIIYAINLLNNTKGYLLNIKQKLGNTNEYYLRVSTQIVNNALHNVVEEVNEAQQPLVKISELLSKMEPRMRSIFLSGDNDLASNFRQAENNFKTTLREAWKATLLMDGFDMENGFKARYRENRNTLKSMCDDVGISTYANSSTSTRPIPRPTTSSTRSTTQSRPSYITSSSSSSSNEDYGCLIWGVVAMVAGVIGAAITQSAGGFIFGILIVAGIWGKIK